MRSCARTLGVVIVLAYYFSSCCGQIPYPTPAVPTETLYPTYLHNGLSEGIGNFSLEVLYWTTKMQPNVNLILSPMTVWTVLAVIREGAEGSTANEISQHAIMPKIDETRARFKDLIKWLVVTTNTVKLANLNMIFADQQFLLEKDFQSNAKTHYNVSVIPLNFSNSDSAVKAINDAVSTFTRKKITKLVDSNDFVDTRMILMSALYFQGQWSAQFDPSATEKKTFYNSQGAPIGEVNMMYKRATFPFAALPKLQARIIELPYGKENRLSMLVMLPNMGVSLDKMFRNFYNVPLDTVFKEIRQAQELYGDDEVDCYFPRFKIESDIDLKPILQTIGINEIFKPTAYLTKLARQYGLHVSKIIHKALIEVNEEGTTAVAITASQFHDRISIPVFEANRPFAYMIVEKVTNSIVFGGVYQQPSLY